MSVSEPPTLHDPLTWLLEFVRAAGYQAAALDTPTSDAARQFFRQELPAYRADLDETLLPLLKRRLRNDDDDTEEELRRNLFVASAELQTIADQLAGPSVGVETMRALRLAWETHLERMQIDILPAVHQRLSDCDLDLLGAGLARHHDLAWHHLTVCHPAGPG